MTENLFGGACSLDDSGSGGAEALRPVVERWVPRLQLRASAAALTAVDGGMHDGSHGV